MKKFFSNLLSIVFFYGGVYLIVSDIRRGEASFLGKALEFALNVIDNVGMFFVGIFAKVATFFSFIVNLPVWLMGKLGGLLHPVLKLIPDSPIIPIILFILLGMLFILLSHLHDSNQARADKFIKRTYAWSFAAINLGMIIAGSGNSLIWMSGAYEAHCLEVPMTLLNISEWSGFARTMLSLIMIGGLLVSILYAVENNIRSLIRTWVGLGFFYVLGYGYMSLRLIVTHWLAANVGFIGRLLNIPIGLVEYLILIQFFFGIFAFILPLDAMKAVNETSEKFSQQTSSKPSFGSAGDDLFDTKDGIPAYVTDENGNNYQVSLDGDFLYIYLPSGDRLSKEWDDIKGDPYFYINGKRFYPH